MTTVLFSNDVNLCTKAMVSRVSAFTKQDLVLGLNRLGTTKQSKSTISTKATVDSISSRMDQPIKVQSVTQAKQPTKDAKPKPIVPAVIKPTEHEEHDFADDILCEMKKSLTQGLSAALEREMKSAFDEQWLFIVVKKPPWTFQDLLRCYDKHWIAIFGMFLNKVDQSYFKEIKEHFTARKGYGGVAVEEVSHLLFSSHELIKHLHGHDKTNDILQQSAITLASLLEKCNKHTSKLVDGSQSSTSGTSTTTRQQNNAVQKIEFVPNRTSSPCRTSTSNKMPPQMVGPMTTISTSKMPSQMVGSTTTSSISNMPQQLVGSTVTTTIRQVISQTNQRTLEQTQSDEISGSGAGERLSMCTDDGDVEMVSEEICVPSALSDNDATASVMQVFQAVGETVFEKSSSLISAAAENSMSNTSQSSRDRYIIERSLLFLCYLLLPIIIGMAKLLQCSIGDDSESCYHGICDALDVFTRECNISPMGSGLQPSSFHQFMSTESNKQTLANGLTQFAGKLQELQEYIKHVDSDFYMKCQQTLLALANHTFC
ncbi:uncharacterized protein [Amphiura filiformis]|uniref:uncharacterized protein n=1 Tax=Amphiura filiformis TaxID=82378 RepID=UPI003B2192F9